MRTVIAKVADVVNSRPLTYVSSEEVVKPLTPNDFLKLGPTNVNVELFPTPHPRMSDTGAQLLKNYHRINSLRCLLGGIPQPLFVILA